MSDFYDLIDEWLGESGSLADIQPMVRRAWFYDFADDPLRVWQGKGKLFTSDGNEWLGTMSQDGGDLHRTPSLQDGRDGTSPMYNFTLIVPDLPGQPAYELYDELKADQSKVKGRSLTCYLVAFLEREGLRPSTPISFFKELTMFSVKFAESLSRAPDGSLIKQYTATVIAKDGNFGRSEIPNGSYADTIQKRRAAEHGVAVDKGAEYIAALANRTYTIP